MKSIKRLTGMLLVFCLAVSCIALPASAVSQYYTSARACIEQGPYIYRNVSGRTGYVFVLQSYLCVLAKNAGINSNTEIRVLMGSTEAEPIMLSKCVSKDLD